MGRRSRGSRRLTPPPRSRRRTRLAVLVLAVAALGTAVAFCLRSRGPAPASPRPGENAPAPAPAPRSILDPRELPFPANLPAEPRQKLDRAVELHLGALDSYAAGRSGEGNEQASAALRLYEEAGALIAELGQLDHELVVRMHQAGDARRAFAEARRWLERFPDSADHLETLGAGEYLAGDLAAAAEHLGRAAALRPRSIKLQRQLAKVYSAQGRKEAGLAAADAALRLIGYPGPAFWSHPEAEYTVRAAVETYHRFYDYAGLLPIAEALLKRFPRDSMGLVASGVARRELGDYATAENLLRQVIDDPLNADEVRYELGIAILKQGKPREAAAVLAALLERSPHSSRGYFQLGQCLARLGRAEDAEALFRMSRGLAPSDRELRREIEMRGVGKPAEARRARARALALRGQFREAEAALRDPELAAHPAAAIYLVELLVDNLRGREAEDALREAAKLLGEASAEVRGWRALVLRLEGRGKEAAALLGPLAAAKLPGSAWPRELGLTYLEDLDDPRTALPWLWRALGDPPQLRELSALGQALLGAGEPGEARKVLESIGRGEIEWDAEVRLPLALAVLRTAPAERSAAAELAAGAPPSAGGTRLYHALQAELLAASPDPAERERAAAEGREAERLALLERRWLEARAAIAARPWPDAEEALVAGARLRRELGDRAGAIRLLRLASAARPGSFEANRLLADWLDQPAEVFYRLAPLAAWRRAAPADPRALELERECRRAVSF